MGEHQFKEIAAEINIVMFADGRITFKGPLENKILCWGLLRAADDIVTRHQIEKKNIVVPDMAAPKGSLI